MQNCLLLTYRHSITAHKLLTDKDGNILFLSKENHSNGCINTVDLTYPSAPLFLIYNTELMKGMLNSIFYYSESGRWNKPYPAHDLGTYPIANGQLYGEDMPIEEAGNMILTVAAIAKMEGNADYAAKHWETLSVWANYLIENGLDPKNQLCTDDFAGHLAHNANLSAKAIIAIAGYGEIARMLGKEATANRYIETAKQLATEWEKMARDGDHYKLAFDKPGTWSQKYNLVWDKVFNMNIFPQKVFDVEIPFISLNRINMDFCLTRVLNTQNRIGCFGAHAWHRMTLRFKNSSPQSINMPMKPHHVFLSATGTIRTPEI